MKWKLKLAAIFVFAAAIMAFASGASATTKFVKASAVEGGNGNSWATAYNAAGLVSFLDEHEDGSDVDIYVAAGTYSPSEGDSFLLKKGVKLYGGFPATGNPTMADRDWIANKTILSGGSIERETAVVICEGTEEPDEPFTFSTFAEPDTRLDGFTITGGNSSESGGGMANYYASPTVANCTFSGNTAYYDGGGMYNYNSSPVVVNCTFSGNTAEYGGGMDNYNDEGEQSPVVVNTIFWGNTATSEGSQIYHDDGSTLTLKNCVVPTGGTAGAGTIDQIASVTADPLLGIFNRVYYPLKAGSSAIGKGLAVGNHTVGSATVTVPAKDQAGKARPASPAMTTIGSIEGIGGVVIEPVKPVLPEGTPSNVTASLFVKETSAADAAAKIGIPATNMIVAGDDLILKPDLAKSLGASAGLTSEFTSMPIFTAPGGAGFVPGNVIAVGFRMDGSLLGSLVSKVSVLKILTATTAEKLVYTDKPAEFGDGKFTIMTDADGIYTGTIVAADKYKLIVFIKDGGKYDLDGKADASVSDPAVVFAAPTTPTDVSSGCNAAVPGTAFAFVLAALPLILKRKK